MNGPNRKFQSKHKMWVIEINKKTRSRNGLGSSMTSSAWRQISSKLGKLVKIGEKRPTRRKKQRRRKKEVHYGQRKCSYEVTENVKWQCTVTCVKASCENLVGLFRGRYLKILGWRIRANFQMAWDRYIRYIFFFSFRKEWKMSDSENEFQNVGGGQTDGLSLEKIWADSSVHEPKRHHPLLLLLGQTGFLRLRLIGPCAGRVFYIAFCWRLQVHHSQLHWFIVGN